MAVPARGDIYHIEIAQGEALGHELSGPHWWVVLSTTQLNAAIHLFTAVPLTSVINKETGKPKDDGDFRYFRIRVLSSSKVKDAGRSDRIFEGDSIALTEQTRSFSDFRIKDQSRAGVVDKDALGAIEAGLLFVIGNGIHRQQSSGTSVSTASAQPIARARVVVSREPPKPLPGKPFNPKS